MLFLYFILCHGENAYLATLQCLLCATVSQQIFSEIICEMILQLLGKLLLFSSIGKLQSCAM